MRGVGLVVACLLAANGCIRDSLVQCGDLLCPVGTQCVPAAGACFPDDRIDACLAADDGTACVAGSVENGVCRSGVCFPPGCGDGIVEAGEDCDGVVANGETCAQHGFYDAVAVGCTADCRYDLAPCTGFCGDGVVSAGHEACDGNDLGGLDCTDLGFYDPEGLKCGAFCAFDRAGCHRRCGDGIVNGPELCDNSLPPSDVSCYSVGYDIGSVGCSSICGVDTSECGLIGWRVLVTSIPGTVVAPLDLVEIEDVRIVSGLNFIYRQNGSLWEADTLPDLQTNLVVSGLWGPKLDNIYATVSTQAGPLLFHYDGTVWTSGPAPTTTTLSAIRGTSASDIWAVGASGTAVHFDGSSWTEFPTGVTANLTRLVVLGQNDAYAVGAAGTIVHWNGTAWSQMTSGVTTTLGELYAFDATHIFVGTTGGKLLSGDGQSWTIVQTSSTGTIDGIIALAPDRLLLATSAKEVLYFDGQRYIPLDAPVAQFGARRGLAGSDGNYYFVTPALNGLLVMQGALPAWIRSRKDGVGATQIAVLSPTDAYAIGDWGPAGFVDTVFHFDGKTWTDIYYLPSGTFPPRATALLARSTDDVWIASDENVVYHLENNTWTTIPTPFYLNTGLDAQPGGPVYLTCTSGIFHYDGMDWVLDLDGGFDDLQTFPDGRIVTVGGNFMARFDGTWTTQMYAGINFRVVWGVSADDFWAAGDDGALAHWQNGVWTRIYVNVFEDITGIDGTAADDIWFVTTFGQLYRYDGTSWSPVRARFDSSSQPQFRDVDATSSVIGIAGLDGRLDLLYRD